MGPNAPLRTSSAISPIRPFDLKKPGDSNGASRFLRLDNLSGQVFPLFAPFVTEPRAVATGFACCQSYKPYKKPVATSRGSVTIGLNRQSSCEIDRTP